MASVPQVRPAESSDVSSLALALESVRGEDLGEIAIELPADGVSDEHAQLLLGAVRSIGGEVLVASSSDAVSGFLVLTPTAEPGSRGVGFAVAVVRHWRRQGVGRALVSSAQRWSSAAGFQHMDLWVRTDNTPARALYSQMGFNPTEKATNRESSSRIRMRLPLTEAVSPPSASV